VSRISLRSTWPWVVLALAVAIVALSFVPAWLTHHREMRGEGYRTLLVGLSAWQLGAVPVVSAGVIGAAVTGLVAVAPGRVRALAPLAAAIPPALFAAAAVPIAHNGQVSSLALAPGWALGLGLLGAVAALGVAITHAPRHRRILAVLPLMAVLVGGGAFLGRVAMLNAAESDRPHWSAGVYERDGVRLELTESSYRAGDRWAGAFSSSGLTVVLTDDPACPDARGAYRIFDAGGDDIRWNLIVDVCADGARGEALEGTWARVP
jgi:hypothetical protein